MHLPKHLETPMNTTIEHHIPDATKMVESDYYAVYVQRDAKSRGNFLLHVFAKGKADAMRISKAHGHKLPRWSYAVHVGKSGYYAALREAFSA